MFEIITAKQEHVRVHVGDCAVCTQCVSACEDASVVCVQIHVACMCVCARVPQCIHNSPREHYYTSTVCVSIARPPSRSGFSPSLPQKEHLL